VALAENVKLRHYRNLIKLQLHFFKVDSLRKILRSSL
jgi:hypothetical protein